MYKWVTANDVPNTRYRIFTVPNTNSLQVKLISSNLTHHVSGLDTPNPQRPGLVKAGARRDGKFSTYQRDPFYKCTSETAHWHECHLYVYYQRNWDHFQYKSTHYYDEGPIMDNILSWPLYQNRESVGTRQLWIHNGITKFGKTMLSFLIGLQEMAARVETYSVNRLPMMKYAVNSITSLYLLEPI